MKGHRAGIYLHHTEWLQGGEPQRFNSSRGVNPASAGKTLVLCVSHTQKHAHTDKQTNVGRRINTNTTVITTWQHVMDWPSDRNTTAAEQTFELVKEWTKRAEVWSLIKTNLQMCQIHTHTHTRLLQAIRVLTQQAECGQQWENVLQRFFRTDLTDTILWKADPNLCISSSNCSLSAALYRKMLIIMLF